jgi:hypothetical protein
MDRSLCTSLQSLSLGQVLGFFRASPPSSLGQIQGRLSNTKCVGLLLDT